MLAVDSWSLRDPVYRRVVIVQMLHRLSRCPLEEIYRKERWVSSEIELDGTGRTPER